MFSRKFLNPQFLIKQPSFGKIIFDEKRPLDKEHFLCIIIINKLCYLLKDCRIFIIHNLQNK